MIGAITKKFSNNKGFSIVELLIAMGIFVIVVSTTVGIFIRALQTQKIALSLIEANDNLVSALEQIAREIRVGTDFTANNGYLKFTNSAGQETEYNLSDGIIFKKQGSSNFKKITSETIEVQRFNFEKNFDSPDYPSRIIINIGAVSKKEILRDVPINIQTTVSSRIISRPD